MTALAKASPKPGSTVDSAVLREVFDAQHAFVYRSALRLGVDTAAVDDVVQETFIIVGRKLGEFEGRSSLQTWLFAILMRVASTQQRAEQRRQRRAAVAAQNTPLVDDPYTRSEAADVLHRLLRDLDEDRRAALILSDLEGLTAVEIAEGLGVNLNTIYSRIRTARQQIEAGLDELRKREGGP